MKDNPDSFDQLNLDFSKFIRELQQKKAHISIFLLVDQFISITKIFGLISDEYSYFQTKYRSSEISSRDLTQTEIVMYLKEMIERLEKITGKTFKAEQLKKTATENWEDKSDFTELQKLKDDISQYPDLVEIFKETVVNISETSRENLKKPPKPIPIKKSQNTSNLVKPKQIQNSHPSHDSQKKYTLTPIPKRLSSEKTEDWIEWSSETSPIRISEENHDKKNKKSGDNNKKSSKNDPDLMNILSDFDKKNKYTKNSGNSVVSLEDLAFKKKVPNFKDEEEN
ncbi:hypothetical protein DSAG12_03396 [Promethearchaeum syntrophicum]|uniref:Uncharacterized protein n=1 Tax=Promethearchaeum syntrophicum TaxID=2594042 RepID=A0A5B9DE17_9ARCH|nr:hypothetical protein [Candidatus Prometheoarchaeum syntrophicum]QEE17559.1 hypothetical protein DSAG12_03396 [Candidatus Prometheoarchaeum syntrophicum]